MRLAVRPFAVAADDSVRFTTAWHEVRGDHVELLGESIKDWDYLTVLRLRADLEVDTAAVRRSAHLGSSAALMVAVSAGSSSTRIRGPVWARDLTPTTAERVQIEFEVAGGELGGRLDLITQLIVGEPDPADELGSPHRGAIIWRDRHSVVLEGDAAQFPTETADLSAAPYNLPKAAWLLEIVTDDLDVAAAAAVRLVVNDAHPVMRRVLDGDSSADAVLALEAMRWDVARQLIETGLNTPEFVERNETFEEDSFGWILASIVATHFPGESPRSLSALRDVEPSKFEATLQDAARVLG